MRQALGSFGNELGKGTGEKKRFAKEMRCLFQRARSEILATKRIAPFFLHRMTEVQIQVINQIDETKIKHPRDKSRGILSQQRSHRQIGVCRNRLRLAGYTRHELWGITPNGNKRELKTLAKENEEKLKKRMAE